MIELKQAPVWVCWKRELTPDGKPTKIPKNPKTGGNAASDKPTTWTTYEQAEAAANNFDGVGFMFTNDLAGIDIDGINGDPEREEQAREIISHMQTYTEYSPSGTGYHLIFRCDPTRIPENYKNMYFQKNVTAGLECYLAGKTKRYFTFTGEAINNGWNIENRTNQLLTFLDKYMKKKNPPRRGNAIEDGAKKDASLNVSDILSIARKSRNNKKFSELFDRGDTSAYDGDDSSADLALCDILAFYTQDPAVIDEIFRQSKLYREKWEREDYRTGTIQKAIDQQEQTGKHYSGKRQTRKKAKEPKEINIPAKVTTWPGAVYFNPFETPETRQRYRPNDIGAGNFFADVYKNVSRYVPEAKSWYIYDGRVWRMDLGGMVVGRQAKVLTDYMMDCRKYIDDDDQREAWVKFVAGRMRKLARDNMLSDAEKEFPVSITEFDKDPYLFNCQNCTLDLRTFTMHKHQPDDLLSKISNVVFDPAARCDRWIKFIKEVMCDDTEKARFLQKGLGYSLIGETFLECFFMLYGATSRNGKGTCMETTLHLHGDYGSTAMPETIAQKQITHSGGPTEDVARLKGARFVNMSEPEKGLRLNSALVKQITGGDTVTARFLHQNSFEYRPQYKLFVNTNYLPRVLDDSIFASGRVKLIPFERHFPENEQDTGLKTLFKKPENISGIFNWFIEGLKLMQTEGLQQPKAVLEATNQYREDSDIIGQFIRERLIKVPSHNVLLKDVSKTYEAWCEETGYRAYKSNLAKELRLKGLKVENGTGNKVYVFDYGIADTSDTELPFD